MLGPVGLTDIVLTRNHKEQDRVPLNMTQETDSKTLPFVRPLDNPRNVGHRKRLFPSVADNSKLRSQRRKGVVRPGLTICELFWGTVGRGLEIIVA